MAEEIQQEFFGIPRCAIRWDVSRDTVDRAVRRGDLKAIRLAGRVLIPRSEVERVERFGLGNGRKPRKKAKA